MKKGIVLAVIIIVLLATSGFCADKPKSIKEDLKVTWVEGNGKKDGYIEVTTRSGDVYRIWPCGEVKKLTWKEIAPNNERGYSGQVLYGPSDGYIQYNDATKDFTWVDTFKKGATTLEVK